LEQLEIPSTFKRLGTALDIAIKSSGAESMRGVLEVVAAARVQMSVGDMDDMDSKLMQSLDKVEKELGGPLMRSDKKGMALFLKEVDVSIVSPRTGTETPLRRGSRKSLYGLKQAANKPNGRSQIVLHTAGRPS
jgi:hypothetical protein